MVAWRLRYRRAGSVRMVACDHTVMVDMNSVQMAPVLVDWTEGTGSEAAGEAR